jgi:hypothetical protein
MMTVASETCLGGDVALLLVPIEILHGDFSRRVFRRDGGE